MATNLAFKADTIKSVAFGSITGSYANLGSALSFPLQILIIKNTTDVTLFVSENGTDDHYELPAGTTDGFDLQTNAISGAMGVKAAGTQFQVKANSGSLPATGKIIIQGQYL